MRVLSIWSPDPSAKHPPEPEQMQQMMELIVELKSKGVLIDTGGAMDGSMELRYSRKNGKDTITDGPFAEAKEVIGGFALFEVADREEALALTRRFLDVAGDGTCELHEVSAPPG
jgi:hypothetical protein